MKIADKIRNTWLLTYDNLFLNEWEAGFVYDIQFIKDPSDKQLDKLKEIYNKQRFIMKSKPVYEVILRKWNEKK